MIRPRGRCGRGRRLVEAGPHGHWQTSTFIGALRHIQLTAPCVLDGAINGEFFKDYVEQVLVPILSRGDTVIMDNLGSRKVAGLREAIEAAGASILYLAPYSSDLNPIEQAFAKLKALLKAEKLRKLDDLWKALGTLLDQFSPKDCKAYFANAGYLQSA